MSAPNRRDALTGADFHPPGLFDAARAAQPHGRFGLLPYERWGSSDKRPVVQLDQRELRHRMLEIVRAEGPILLRPAYLACNRWRSPQVKAGSFLRLVAEQLLHEKLICVRGVMGSGSAVLHLPDAPTVVVRELGPRILEQVPPTEIAELMIRTRVDLRNEVALFKAVFFAYGIGIPTDKQRGYLRRCLKVAREH